MNTDTKTDRKTFYDTKTVKRVRNIFVQALMIIDERRNNLNKPNDYVDPTYQYEMISLALSSLEGNIETGISFNASDNKDFLNAYHAASTVYYERIMTQFRYYQSANVMMSECNGKTVQARTNLILAMGGPHKKVA